MGKLALVPVEKENDEGLFVRYQEGSEEAFEELVTRYWGEAYRLALRFLGDKTLAEDVAQGAFVEMVRYKRSFDGSRPFRPWFRTIVLNGSRRLASKKAKRRAHEIRGARRERVEQSSESLELREHVDKLPAPLREAVILRFYEGYTYSELGEALKCPKDTARSRTTRALELLAGSLGAGGVSAVEQELGSKAFQKSVALLVPKIPLEAFIEPVLVVTRRSYGKSLALLTLVSGIGALTILVPEEDPDWPLSVREAALGRSERVPLSEGFGKLTRNVSEAAGAKETNNEMSSERSTGVRPGVKVMEGRREKEKNSGNRQRVETKKVRGLTVPPGKGRVVEAVKSSPSSRLWKKAIFVEGEVAKKEFGVAPQPFKVRLVREGFAVAYLELWGSVQGLGFPAGLLIDIRFRRKGCRQHIAWYRALVSKEGGVRLKSTKFEKPFVPAVYEVQFWVKVKGQNPAIRRQLTLNRGWGRSHQELLQTVLLNVGTVADKARAGVDRRLFLSNKFTKVTKLFQSIVRDEAGEESGWNKSRVLKLNTDLYQWERTHLGRGGDRAVRGLRVALNSCERLLKGDLEGREREETIGRVQLGLKGWKALLQEDQKK